MPTPITSLPLEISEPGEFVLTESLCLESGEFAVKVNVPGVSIDLGGHTLEAKSGMTIHLCSTDFSLRNGTLKSSSLALVPAPHVRPDRCRFYDLQVQGVLFLGGDHLVFERCKVEGATHGIRAGLHARVADCEVSGALLGVEVGAGSEVLRTKVTHCEEGVYAYGNRDSPVHLEKLLVYECDGLGLRLDGPGTALRCEVHNNGQVEPAGGILAGPASIVRECEAYGNKGGDIAVVEPCELHDNRTSGS
jgi:hypothetical protein